MDKLPKFQEPSGPLPANFVPDQSKLSAAEQFQLRQNSPFYSFINTINSEEGKKANQYSGKWYYSSTKDNPRQHWRFIRSEEPLKPMEQEIAEYLPGTGDAAEVANIGKDISQGNIGQALLAAGLLILPGNASGIIRKTGNNAVDMFRTYNKNHIINIPENSELYPEIQKLIPEARKRYGLIDNTDISDEEIAKALYGRAQELGFATAARYSTGEPRLFFRGDTRRYESLKDRPSPEELAEAGGTMDNSYGNLFLGELPLDGKDVGIGRYLGRYEIAGLDHRLVPSATGDKIKLKDGTIISSDKILPFESNISIVGPILKDSKLLNRFYNTKSYKLPDSYITTNVNDINPFIIRTPKVRDATSEISVLQDRELPKLDSYLGGTEGKNLGLNFVGEPEKDLNYRLRVTASHIKNLLKNSEQKGQGLLFSSWNSPLRSEHSAYSYWAVPNFNKRGVKHLFGYDITKPVDWNIDNIYLKQGGKVNGTD